MNPDDETLLSMINAERDMLLAADEVHGEYFQHAVNMVAFLNNMAASVDRPEQYLAAVFFSQTRKHLTLALFSATRRHHIQMGMNLRQVLEAGAWGAYAFVYNDPDLFREEGPDGTINVPQRLSDARNRWLDENDQQKSEQIRNLKTMINKSMAHASVMSAFHTFNMVEEGFQMPFFDIEDDFTIKTDLLMVANFAMGMIELFATLNQQERIFRNPEGADARYQELVAQHNRLREEVGNHERFRVIREAGARDTT